MPPPCSARRTRYSEIKGARFGPHHLPQGLVPLSTDLYLPALPGMALYFGVSADLANLTLILFFVFFGAGTLFWGPLSDRYGRRPVLLAALSIYTAASLGCAASGDIHQLIAFRIFQAVGGSGAFAVATAMVKDVYESKRREPILAMVQSMVLISPVGGPPSSDRSSSSSSPGGGRSGPSPLIGQSSPFWGAWRWRRRSASGAGGPSSGPSAGSLG